MFLLNHFVKYIEVGDATSACITNEQKCYLWGCGLNGRLGNGERSNIDVPLLSQELLNKSVNAITMGSNNTFAIMGTKCVLAWGSSKNGKLGFKMP